MAPGNRLKRLGQGMLALAAAGGLAIPGASAQSWNPDCYNGRLTCVSIGAPRELTPEEKAEQDRRTREAAIAKAERERKEALAKAEFDRQVEVEVQRLGTQRRAEAERLVQMRNAAQAARPKSPYPPRVCTTSTTTEARKGVFLFMSGDKKTYQAEGRAEMARNVESACTGGSMTSYSCKGGGAIGVFNCQVAYTCPVKQTTCTGGPPASKVSPQ